MTSALDGQEPMAAVVQVQCTDMEDYARIFNEGFDEARRQFEADVRTAGARALKEAAAEQRRLAEESRTNNGQAEHTDFADWLEERAEQLAGGSDEHANEFEDELDPFIAEQLKESPEFREAYAAAVVASKALLDREAVKKAVQDELAVHLAGTPALVHLQMLVGPRVADVVMGMVRPMPTREQIAASIRAHDALGCGCCAIYDFDKHEDRGAAIADSVLALLNGAES